ncbi:MAG: phospho-N-acetylmuramoyl-pentapeptide-transferase [Armatimonadetes bacterium]|nr:phospho-N-acetylmuramoyl-pentapeptide-transferase [Armatimonadota bacterium]
MKLEAAQGAMWLVTAASFAGAAALSWLACRAYLGLARRRGLGQPVRSDGPKTHLAKTGTPTMGGAAFIPAALVVAAAATVAQKATSQAGSTGVIWPVLAASAGMALIGLADDLSKILAGKSRGIPARWRIVGEFLLAAGAVYLIDHALADAAPRTFWLGAGELGEPWAFIVRVCCIVGSANAVNFTDGVDGLAGSLVFLAAWALAACGLAAGVREVSTALAACAGGCAGFLWFNRRPAQLFMGDVGSLGLGGLIGAAAVALRIEFLYALLGAIFAWETLSVIFQVASFRATGRRIFRMSPFHHHLELCGWSENAIVATAAAVQAGLAAATVGLFLAFGVRPTP